MKYFSIGLLLMAGSAAAEETGDCARIEDSQARLDCYDRKFSRTEQDGEEATEPPAAGGDLQKAAETGAIIVTVPVTKKAPAAEQAPADEKVTVSKDVTDSAEPTPAREAVSAEEGESLEKTTAPEKGGMFNWDERVDLTSRIVAVRNKDQQKMVFRLENDQIWMQSTPRLLRIREGDEVTIENATMGGYMLRTSRGVTTRVERIR